MKRNIPDKLFACGGGGLGDIYYFCLFDKLAYLQDIKEKNPSTKIHVVISSKNPISKELLEHNPYIDEFDVINPKDRIGIPLGKFKKPGYTKIDSVIAKGNFKKNNSLFLTKEDRKFVSKIKREIGDSKYIVIHPFSADAFKRVKPGQRESRYVFPVEEYFPLVESFQEKGYKVLVCGGNSRKRPILAERFDYSHPNVIDLIDKTNPRTAAQIIKDANGFIGTYSCFLGIAWGYGVRSFLLAPDGIWRNKISWKNRIESWDRWGWATRKPQNKIVYLPSIIDGPKASYKKTHKEILDWF